MSASSAKCEAWIALPSEADIKSQANGAPHPYEEFLGGVVARMARLLMAHSLIGPVFRQLSAAILFGPGSLSRQEREMVAAAAQACEY